MKEESFITSRPDLSGMMPRLTGHLVGFGIHHLKLVLKVFSCNSVFFKVFPFVCMYFIQCHQTTWCVT